MDSNDFYRASGVVIGPDPGSASLTANTSAFNFKTSDDSLVTFVLVATNCSGVDSRDWRMVSTFATVADPVQASLTAKKSACNRAMLAATAESASKAEQSPDNSLSICNICPDTFFKTKRSASRTLT
jgi:hypothetical protein